MAKISGIISYLYQFGIKYNMMIFSTNNNIVNEENRLSHNPNTITHEFVYEIFLIIIFYRTKN